MRVAAGVLDPEYGVSVLGAAETRTEPRAIEGPRRSLADLKALAANITRFATPPGCARGPG
jgi:hypothetical protein